MLQNNCLCIISLKCMYLNINSNKNVYNNTFLKNAFIIRYKKCM